MTYWAALLIATLANIGANIAFKGFVARAELGRGWSALMPALQQPTLWVGFVLCAVLLGGYLYALKGLPMGLAYTFATCVSIVGVTVAGAFFFNEALNLRASMGVAAIMVGLILMIKG